MPRWDPYIHGGLTFVDAMPGDIFYPPAILQLLLCFLWWEQPRFNLSKIAAPVLFFIIAVVLAMGASSIQWLAPYQYLAKYSQRIQHHENRGGGFWARVGASVFGVISPGVKPT